MGRRLATRLGALAGGVSLAVLGPFAQVTHAEDATVPGGDAVFDGPVGVVLFGPGTENPEPPVDEEPPPATQPPAGEEPPPASQPAPTSTSDPDAGPLAATTNASGAPRPPKRSVAQPAPVPTLPKAAGVALPSSGGRWATLEEIFLRDRPRSASAGGTIALQSARPTVPNAQSSLPTLLMTSLVAMLAALALASKQYGQALFTAPVRQARPRRSAPRGWRVVSPATRVAPPASTVPQLAASAIEQPVLTAGGAAPARSSERSLVAR